MVAQRRHGLFKHLAPMTWVEAQGQDREFLPVPDFTVPLWECSLPLSFDTSEDRLSPMIAGGILHMARQDGYVPMLHAAAHAALQNQKGKSKQHLLRSIKEQFPGRHGIIATHSSKFHGQSRPISARNVTHLSQLP